MPLLIILAVIAFILILINVKIVKQNTVLVIEFLGKYRRIMVAGLNVKVPFLERVSNTVSLR